MGYKRIWVSLVEAELMTFENSWVLDNIQKKEGIHQYYDYTKFQELKAVFEPTYKILPYVLVEVYDEDEWDDIKNRSYIQCFGFFIEYKGVLLRPHNPSNKKSFGFFLRDYFYSDESKDFQYNVERPNFVGKPTDKKITEWLDYLIEQDKAKQVYHDSKVDKVGIFLKSLEPYKDIIKWHTPNKNGYIERGGLRYEFEIGLNGYISTKVVICEYQIDLNKFMDMSNNTLKK